MDKITDGKNILLIEDETNMARYLELELTYEGYMVDVTHDGREGYEKFEENKYDLVLLDLMLPGINGLEVLRRIRKNSDTPVIIATCKNDVMDKVAGLDSGADDYIAKPFVIEELLARIRVALKKHAAKNSQHANSDSRVFYFKPLTVDIQQRQVRVNEDIVDLTKTEFELLLYLMQNKNNVLTRKQILNMVWGPDYEGQTNIVDVYIRYLRVKIEEKYDIQLIRTVRGVGYYAKEQE